MIAAAPPFLAGRKIERAELHDALASARPELIAVHGRRRVGKTYLIRTVFAEHLCFELTGMRDTPLKAQLANFTRALTSRVSYPLAPPGSWVDAFEMLKRFLTEELVKGDRKVVFLDELPWLASPRSGFLSALDHFWNSFGSKQRNLILVICGSAASWMIVNVLHQKGGLHNRVTRTLALKPFNLHETEAFLRGRGIALDRYQILELFMAVGGIPYYLDYVRKGRSAAQNIDAMFFAQNAPLRDEFDQLYAALFEHHERHMKVIHALAKKRSGMTRQELRASTRLPTGGRLTTT
ncbi:MAG: AAA family ATPase, partial [Steroidobacteraceae bacterium]